MPWKDAQLWWAGPKQQPVAPTKMNHKLLIYLIFLTDSHFLRHPPQRHIVKLAAAQ